MDRFGPFIWLILLTGSVGILGCSTPGASPMSGESLADHGPYTRGQGDQAPGFRFVSSDGRLRSFSEVRGDVTLVLFAEDPEWPDCEACSSMADLAGRLSSVTVDVVVVTLSKAEGAPGQEVAEFRACAISSNHLVAISDRHSAIRTDWGPDAAGRFFVVNHRGRIEGTGAQSDLQAAENLLSDAVAEAEEMLPNHMDG
jgi:hypothetical protein